MQTVDLIIAHIDWLITVDSGRRIIRDAAIAVQGGKIAAVGKSAEIAKGYTGKKTVSGRHTVATPGYVDCHLHSSFQLSRGLADEANAQSFLFDRMYPYEAALDADDVRISATLALIYPPGIGIVLPGERWDARARPMLDYFLAFQEAFNRFPGFNYEVQGVYQEREDGRIRFYTYVVRE